MENPFVDIFLEYDFETAVSIIGLDATMYCFTLWIKDLTDESEEDPEINYDCKDNFRCCQKGNYKQEKAYDIQAKHGCCGVYEITIVYNDEDYVFGFNYGH